MQRFEGFFLEPSYDFGRTGAGGTARAHRLPRRRSARVATGATYTSCPRDGSGDAGLAAERPTACSIDFEANEGIAEGAVLRFYGVPILARRR